MKDYKTIYKKELENELTRFLFLCDKKDAQIILSQTKKNYSAEHLRLACVCMIFGYKKLFLKIVALAEKNIDNFFKDLENLNENFVQIDKWATDFVENITLPEIQELARKFWKNKKQTIDAKNFNIKQLL